MKAKKANWYQLPTSNPLAQKRKMHNISFTKEQKNQKTPFLHVGPSLFTNILHLKEIKLRKQKQSTCTVEPLAQRAPCRYSNTGLAGLRKRKSKKKVRKHCKLTLLSPTPAMLCDTPICNIYPDMYVIICKEAAARQMWTHVWTLVYWLSAKQRTICVVSLHKALPSCYFLWNI